MRSSVIYDTVYRDRISIRGLWRAISDPRSLYASSTGIGEPSVRSVSVHV